MKALNTHSHSKFHSIIHSDFWNFEFSIWLHMVGWTLVSIFVPVLILKAYSLQIVILYYFVFFLIDVPLNFLAKKLVTIIGARAVIIIATLAVISYLLTFNYLYTGSIIILFALAILAAIYDTFYWVAHLYLFIESSGKKEEVSKKNGILYSMRSFGGMMGPLIGAAILIFGSQTALLAVSIIFLIFSIFPLLRLRHIKDKPKDQDISYKDFFKELPEKRNFSSWFFYSIHLGVENILWPLFIFTLFGTLKSVALVAVVISVSKMVLGYFSGTLSKVNRERLVMVGALFIMLVWICRIFYPNPIFYYLSIMFVGLFAVMVEVPLDSGIFERSKLKNNSLLASTFRNTIIMFPQLLLFAFLALLVGVFQVSFNMAILSLLILLVINEVLFYRNQWIHKTKSY